MNAPAILRHGLRANRHRLQLGARVVLLESWRVPCAATVSWTEAEERTLLLYWGEVSARRLRERLPGRTWRGIVEHARDALGLVQGVPQGWETRAHAATRAGMSWSALVRILERHGVRTVRHRTARGGSACPWHLVEIDAVDAALAEEFQGWEIVAQAARLRGLSPSGLTKWLREAGVLAAQVGTRRKIRLPSAVIDRVVAERRAQGRRRRRPVAPVIPLRPSRPGPARCAPANDAAELRTAGEGRGRR